MINWIIVKPQRIYIQIFIIFNILSANIWNKNVPVDLFNDLWTDQGEKETFIENWIQFIKYIQTFKETSFSFANALLIERADTWLIYHK